MSSANIAVSHMSSAALAFVFNPDCRKLVSLDPSTTVIRVYDVPSLRLSLTLDGSGEPSEATRSSIRTIPYLFTINHASELLQVSPFGRVTRRLDDNFLRSSSERLVARISSSTSSLVRETSDILTILSGSAVECKRALRHRVSHVCLWLSKQWEECDAVDKALTACARLLHSIDEIRSGDVTDLMTGVSFLLALPLHAPPRLSVYVCTAGDGLITPFARVQWGVDPAKTVVSGPGARVAHAGHTETAKRMNVVSIEPRDGDGETVHGLSVADVHVEVVVNGTSLPATAVSVSQSSETSFQVNYTVPTDSCGRKVALYVSLCQSPLTRLDVEVPGIISGTYEASYTAGDARRNNSGLAINEAASVMAVASAGANHVGFYSLPEGSLTLQVDVQGPQKMCFTASGNLLVAEGGKSRVIELTGSGEFIRSLGDGVINSPIWGIAVDSTSQRVAVGKYESGACDPQVLVLHCATGELLTGFGEKTVIRSSQAKPGTLWDGCVGLRFSPDDQHISVLEYGNNRLSIFSLAGQFICCVGQGVCRWPRDFLWAPNGDILIGDELNRICVFPGIPLVGEGEGKVEGPPLLRSFGKSGRGPGEFDWPSALALNGSLLYVLDHNTPRVQVFS